MPQASHIPKELTACPDCDMLLHTTAADHHQQGHCPRCHALLWDAASPSSDIDFAASVSGLILFIPAITLPILKLDMVGQLGSNSLLGGVWRLWTEGEQLLALLVFLCSLLAPFMQLMLTLMIDLSIRLQYFPKTFPHWLKWLRWMQSWSMLEVYAMGIIVAYVKMMDPGEVSVAVGSYCLAALLLCIILCTQYFHEEKAWQHWEHRQST
jgi:paraquat-inducible protein A